MNDKRQPIDDPKQLVETIEQTIRKDIQALFSLYEFKKIDEDVSQRLIKTRKFLLALILKLDEELEKKGAYE